MSGISAARSCHEQTQFAVDCTLNQGLKCTGCQQLLKMEARIEEARAVVASLEQQRDGLYAIINDSHESLTSQLPTEICSLIFQQAVKTANDKKQRNTTLFSLGRVCKSWRRIAISTPQIWTSLDISISHMHDHLVREADVEIFAELLSRSHSLSISLTIDWGTGKKRRWCTRFLQILKTHGSRCTDLHLTGYACNIEAILRNCGAPDLKKLQVTTSGSFGRGESAPHIITELSKPSSLVMSRTRRISFKDIPIQSTNLTTFDGPLPHYADFFFILCHAPRLKTCLVRFFDEFDDPGAEDGAEIAHSNLSSLEFRSFTSNHESTDFRPIFRKVTLANLSRFVLGGFNQRLMMLEGFDLFLKRSACHIETFHINHGSTLDVDLKELLALMPTIKTFWMLDHEVSFVERILEHLVDTRSYPSAMSGTSMQFLPMLEDIRIKLLYIQEDEWISERLIVDIFPTAEPLPGLVCRPLSSFCLERSLAPGVILQHFFNLGTVQAIKKMRSIGYEIDVRSGYDGCKGRDTEEKYPDFIQQSLEWHEMEALKLKPSEKLGPVQYQG